MKEAVGARDTLPLQVHGTVCIDFDRSGSMEAELPKDATKFGRGISKSDESLAQHSSVHSR